MANGYPVTGSLVQIWYDGKVIGYGQGFKIDMKVDYQMARELGKVYPSTFVLSFITVTGGFTVADYATLKSLEKILTDVGSARGTSAPSGKSFKLVPTDDSDFPEVNTDAPQYIVEDVRFVNMTTQGDISGQLVTTTISFMGRKISAA